MSSLYGYSDYTGLFHFNSGSHVALCWPLLQAWGQSTRYFGTLVLEYRFCSTRQYSVPVILKSTCTRTCTQVLLKMKVLLTSTYEYFTSTSHLKLIQNSYQTNHKSLSRDIQHSVNDSFTIRLAIILKNDLIIFLKLFLN